MNKVIIETSARHLHLSKEHLEVLFGAGYELTVTVTLSGSELDEPEEDEITMTVYKVNGRWVSEDALETLVSMGGMMF